ncbi:macrolide 2'-phosphotransferase [Fischerella muscicola]|nr:macrolide 2'-phosphotransferase [Fischerella muscicola]
MDFITTFATAKEDNTKWVLRFPRRPDVLERMYYEREVLELVKSQVDVSVPIWKIVSDELVAYPLLKGIPAGTIDPDIGDYVWYIDPKFPPVVYICSVAKTLAQLHRTRIEVVKQFSIRVKTVDQVRQSMAENMEKTRELLGVSDTRWTRWQNWIANDALWPEHSALIHGDFHPGHTLVDKDGNLIGLIDWTEAAVSDPAKDFVCFYATFGEQVLQDVLEHYQTAGGFVWSYMKEHIIELWNAHPVEYALFALLTGKEEHIAGARASLAWSG